MLWVFFSPASNLSLVVESRGYSPVAQASHCSGFSCRAQALRHSGFVVLAARGLNSCNLLALGAPASVVVA